jgi:hypothetical protein
MKKRNGFFGLIICASLVLSGGSISKYISANAGYCIAAALTSSPAIQNGAAGAGGLAAVWAGAKIGGKAGAIIGGPVGIVCGAFLGAM